jgi:hypothetical protein
MGLSTISLPSIQRKHLPRVRITLALPKLEEAEAIALYLLIIEKKFFQELR